MGQIQSPPTGEEDVLLKIVGEFLRFSVKFLGYTLIFLGSPVLGAISEVRGGLHSTSLYTVFMDPGVTVIDILSKKADFDRDSLETYFSMCCISASYWILVILLIWLARR